MMNPSAAEKERAVSTTYARSLFPFSKWSYNESQDVEGTEQKKYNIEENNKADV